MNFTLFQGVSKFSKLSNDLFNRSWYKWLTFWNDTDNGKLPISNIAFGVVTNSKTASYTAVITDHLILMDTTSAALTLTLPNSVGIKGKNYIVFNIGIKLLTINTTSSQTINGGTAISLPNQWLHAELFSDGANWVVM